MITWQSIGLTAAVLAFLCVCGLTCLYLLPPRGKHVPGGRHREQPHEGAGSPGHVEELATIRMVVRAAQRHRDKDGAP